MWPPSFSCLCPHSAGFTGTTLAIHSFSDGFWCLNSGTQNSELYHVRLCSKTPAVAVGGGSENLMLRAKGQDK